MLHLLTSENFYKKRLLVLITITLVVLIHFIYFSLKTKIAINIINFNLKTIDLFHLLHLLDVIKFS